LANSGIKTKKNLSAIKNLKSQRYLNSLSFENITVNKTTPTKMSAMSKLSNSLQAVFGTTDEQTAKRVRDVIRKGAWSSHTSGLARDHV
jgi:phosphotransferase system IIB component